LDSGFLLLSGFLCIAVFPWQYVEGFGDRISHRVGGLFVVILDVDLRSTEITEGDRICDDRVIFGEYMCETPDVVQHASHSIIRRTESTPTYSPTPKAASGITVDPAPTLSNTLTWASGGVGRKKGVRSERSRRGKITGPRDWTHLKSAAEGQD
jgi:hypothetical protein